MLKQVIAISLAFLVFAVAAKDLLMLVSFKLNQEFIAKNLCINRDQPEKLCSGKCHLTKKIVESKENAPQQAPVPQADEQKQVLCVQEIPTLLIGFAHSGEPKPLFAERSFTAQSCAFDFFQPPRV